MTQLIIYILAAGMLLFSSFFLQENDHPFENREVFNLGNNVNTTYYEGFPMIMGDGLTLYFSSDRPGGSGGLDIYYTQRTSAGDSWSKPVNLKSINSPASDHSVTVSPDGLTMYFMSKREGGFGSGDIYVSSRKDVTDPDGWGSPENVGPVINTEKLEACPLIHISGNRTELYFVSNRDDIGGQGEIDIFHTILGSNHKSFKKPVNMSEINSPVLDMHFEPLQGLMWSDRKGGVGGQDIWIADFSTVHNEWRNPTPLTYPINTIHEEGMPSITDDLEELIFHSNRPGGEGSFDIYTAK